MKRIHSILYILVALVLIGSARAAPPAQSVIAIPSGSSITVSCSSQLSFRPSSAGGAQILCDAAAGTTVPTATIRPTSAPTVQPTSAPPVATVPAVPPGGASGIWISAAEIADLPMSGTAWDNVNGAANGAWGSPNLSDLNSLHDTLTLAGALVYARTGDAALRTKTANAIVSAVGTEAASRGLEVSRNITSYVIAADLINFRAFDPTREASWRSWLSALRTKTMTDGRTIISTQEDRPNNWGTMATAARVAIDRYLGDASDLNRAATVFHGLLGNRAAYAGFSYGDLSWQCDASAPVGINPLGCLKSGHDIGGVIPDDQRRSGSFAWPPPCAGYAWESGQGIVVAAELLSRGGYPAWDWNDRAILRAYQWLYANGCPPSGDDRGYPWVVNHAYGTIFATLSPAPMGKNGGWFDWTHAR